VARALKVIVFNQQREIVWNSERAFNFKACSGCRDVADLAADSASAIERNRSRF
jgi:uncharacterized metal-binding protein